MTQPALQPQTPSPEEKAAAVQAAAQLASRLRYLTQQESQLKKEKDEIKQTLEELYNANLIPAKDSVDVLYSDGTYRRVQLSREKTGTYFSAKDEYKDELSSDKGRVDAR
jgi:gas vesicle protein